MPAGPSGSGKSTLMNTLGCLDRPTDGSYRLAGEEVAGLTPEPRLARVPQSAASASSSRTSTCWRGTTVLEIKVLLRVVATEATGVLFAEGPTESRRSPRGERAGRAGARTCTSSAGRLHHVSSNNASELLGEFLVRRGVISRDELDFALAVLPRYGGRMGDTLISLGLVALARHLPRHPRAGARPPRRPLHVAQRPAQLLRRPDARRTSSSRWTSTSCPCCSPASRPPMPGRPAARGLAPGWTRRSLPTSAAP